MNRLICLTDWTILKRERVLVLLMTLTLLLSSLALYNGQQWASYQDSLITQAKAEQQQALVISDEQLAARRLQKGPLNWWDDKFDLRGQAFYLMVNYATKPPLASAAIAVGQSDIYPYYFQMFVAPKQDFIHQYETIHPMLLLLGKFDLAFMVIYLLPLLIIGVSFNALAQEKQSGQLRLLMVQGLSPKRLLLNQLILRLSLIIAPLLITSLVGLLWLSPQISLSVLTSFVLLVLAYAIFWLMVSAIVISFGKTAAYNASMLVILWLSLIIIVPALMNTGINLADPAPSRIHYLDHLRVQSDEINNAKNKTLATFFEDHPELVKKKDNAEQQDTDKDKADKINQLKQSYSLTKIAKIDALEQAMQVNDDEFNNSLLAQQSSAKWLKFLSPATLMQAALVDLSGNGLTRQQDFIGQVLQHHQALRQFYQLEIAKAHQAGKFSPCEGCNADITINNLAKAPQFSYQQPESQGAWLTIMLFLAVALSLFVTANRRLLAMNNAGQLVAA